MSRDTRTLAQRVAAALGPISHHGDPTLSEGITRSDLADLLAEVSEAMTGSAAQKPENPPAFPASSGADRSIYVQHDGMTLRDWFAGNAPHGAFVKDNGPHDPVKMAQAAYAYADAMLAERAKGGGR